MHQGVGGIYWVGTRPELARRGLAAALVRRVSNHLFEHGARCVVLQASKMGEPVYLRLGYREITRYRYAFFLREQVEARWPRDAHG